MRHCASRSRKWPWVELARAQALDGFGAVLVRARQGGCADAIGTRAAQLVVHKRDQRADHDAGALQQRRGQLVGQRLACARGHHRQRGLARHDAVDDLALDAPERAESEDFVQLVQQVRSVGCARDGVTRLGGHGGGHARSTGAREAPAPRHSRIDLAQCPRAAAALAPPETSDPRIQQCANSISSWSGPGLPGSPLPVGWRAAG